MAKKSGGDIRDILRNYLATSALMTDPLKPNGSIYKGTKPLNSTKEDVVVNLLYQVHNGHLSEGSLNINTHVPNLTLTVNGVIDRSQPDYARLKYLTGIVYSAIDTVFGLDYNFEIVGEGEDSDENNYTFSNLKVSFNSINI